MNLKLPDVTLFAVSSIMIPETIQSLLYSSRDIDFGSIKILTHTKPQDLPEQIEYVEIPEIKDIMDYNQFCFSELGQYIQTSHGLLTQYHAFIIEPKMWNNDWLECDYLGAIWPLRQGSFKANNGEIVRNGNGGFSLRSKRLMEIPKEKGWELRQDQGYWNEDGNLTVYWRREMLELGINYGTTMEAAAFAYENPTSENFGKQTFGFHRNLNPWIKL